MWKFEADKEAVQDAKTVTKHCLSYTVVKIESMYMLSGNETIRCGGFGGTHTAVATAATGGL
jgi:hypothetical protein